MTRRKHALPAIALLALMGATPASSPRASAPPRPAAPPGVRISMDALHRQGGVPAGWQLTPPPGNTLAGRRAFFDLGCHSCHRVDGEPHSAPDARLGPELTGMGGHHPPAYFAEAIINPNAVLIDAPTYLGSDGRSTMPAYPDLTVAELGDLVAYLGSLTQPTAPSCHANGAAGGTELSATNLDLTNQPTPERAQGTRYFTQTYDVAPGRLPAFEQWFAHDGKRQFLAADGLVSIDTFVDMARGSAVVTSIFGFRDEAALRNFMGDPASGDLWLQFDAFVGPHGHRSYDHAPVYRAPALSVAAGEFGAASSDVAMNRSR